MSFFPDMATPYFANGPAAAGVTSMHLGRYDHARVQLTTALNAAATDTPDAAARRERLRLLIALCDTHLNRHASAARAFAHAADALPQLGPFAHYHAAKAYFAINDINAAAAHARKIPADSRHYSAAELILGQLLLSEQRWKDAAAHYASYLRNRPRRLRWPEARFRLAEAHDRQGNLHNALTHYKKVQVLAPQTPWANEATTRLNALVSRLPPRARRAYTNLTGQEHLERGLALYKAMRNRPSAAAFAAALRDSGLTADQRCAAAFHRANSWWKERNRSRAAPLFDKAIATCDESDNLTLRVKSAYQAGRSYAKLGKHRTAIARYEQAERYDTRYADDARMRQAEEYRDLNEQTKVTKRLSSLPVDYPDGDMRAEALWRLAWRAYKARRYGEAATWLRRQIELVPYDPHWYGAGQPQYWLGRIYAHLGNTVDSIAAYQDCVRTYPLSYYALLALNRLRESHPQSFHSLVKEMQTPPSPDPPVFNFKPRALWRDPFFLLGIEFLKLGLGRDAAAEFAHVGLRAPPDRSEVTDPDQIDRLWAYALLFDRAGRYDKSHWPTRWHITGYAKRWPAGNNVKQWRIAYPLAYAHLIRPQADKHGYPMALQMGIVREESAFTPTLESWANAIGLTQMIKSAARRFSRGTGIAPTSDNLRDPYKNVVIGSNFLGFLHTTFRGQVGLMVPSYNAGEGATWRWMYQRHSPQWRSDEFEEEIPGDQARNYSKRVIASYFAYAYLADGTIPNMPQTVQRTLIPSRIERKLSRRYGRR